MRRTQNAILTLTAAALVAVASVALAAGAPKAVAVEPIKDLGQVVKGEKVSHEFAIQNAGEAPLEITDVQAACGCTATSYDRTIAPGATGKVRAELDTTTFNGPIAKGVTVYTNDPGNPKIELTVRAEVHMLLGVRPGYARFVKHAPQGSGKVEQMIWSPRGEAFEVTRVESPYPFLKVAYRPATDEDRAEVKAASGGYVVELELDYTTAPAGAIADRVMVHTTHARQKIVEIPVSGFVRPAVAVTPPVLDFGDVQITAPIKASVHVQGFADGIEFTVTKVEDDLAALEAVVEPIEKAGLRGTSDVGREFRIRLTLKPDMPKGAFNGTLKLYTNHPRSPVVEVPVKGRAV
jgi:hypothetical protein